MNRHRLFYANLANELDDDDDYYDQDDYEDEYYEENYDGEYNEEYYEEVSLRSGDETTLGVAANDSNPTNKNCNQSTSTAKKTVINPYFSISPEKDTDFDLLASMIPHMDELWKGVSGLPLGEEEVIAGLRHCDYDLDRALTYLKEQREEKKKQRQGRPGLLRASGTNENSNLSNSAQSESKNEGVPSLVINQGPPGERERGGGGTLTCLSNEGKTDSLTSPSSPSSLQRSATTYCTLIIAGHVDAGKSTIIGHLLVLLGKISLSSLASPKNGEEYGSVPHSPCSGSPRYAWLLDQSEEERRRGVTIDAGTYNFETEHRSIHVLDAPGHMEYVLSMMSSATQADAALLIVSAANGEFESGLHHGTKEHLRILHILGVGSIIVGVNKLDMVEYAESRYNDVVREVKKLFDELQLPQSCIAGVCPISGIDGTNITRSGAGRQKTPWYNGPSLVELLDTCPLESRFMKGPLRISVQDVQGRTLYVKIESGQVTRGAKVQFLPCETVFTIKSMTKPGASEPVKEAVTGEQVELLLSTPAVGLFPGCVGCLLSNPVPVSSNFEARIQTFETLEKPLLPGSSLLLIAHAVQVNIRMVRLVSIMDACNGDGQWRTGRVKCIPKDKQAIVVFRAETKIALEPVEVCPSLGRFALSQDGNTVVGGLIQKVLP